MPWPILETVPADHTFFKLDRTSRQAQYVQSFASQPASRSLTTPSRERRYTVIRQQTSVFFTELNGALGIQLALQWLDETAPSAD